MVSISVLSITFLKKFKEMPYNILLLSMVVQQLVVILVRSQEEMSTCLYSPSS